MPRKVKCTKERCLKCQYSMNLTGASMVKKGDSGALIACGYCLKNKEAECRTVKGGKKRAGNGNGFCTFFEEGPRKQSMDALTRKDSGNTTIKKGRIANART